jgi:biopolymer transport protein ExbB
MPRKKFGPQTLPCRFLELTLLLLLAGQATVVRAQTDEVPQISDESVLDRLPDTAGSAASNNSGITATSGGNPSGENGVVHEKGLNLLSLLARGGWFMVPLALLSLLVVALGIERVLALRENKILPRALVLELGSLSRNSEGFDPRSAFRICQSFPSSAARVLRVMLLKAGRPQAEIENAVMEAGEREATRLQGTVSWLTLAAAVAPLIGLLGTVWGMIQAFYDTTQLIPGQNKAEILAQGIYTALVTTLCGLIIAIPSAVLAHYFDNRIVNWFHKIEELAASLIPMLEPFEGQVRTVADPDSVMPGTATGNGDVAADSARQRARSTTPR